MTEFRVGLVQNGECTNDVDANASHLEALVSEVATHGTDVVVLPELCTTPYFPLLRDTTSFSFAETIPGPTTDRFGRLARRHGTNLVMGLFEKTANGEYYDSAVVLGREGHLLEGSVPSGRRSIPYRKMMIPSVAADGIDSDEKFFFRPGAEPVLYEVDGIRLGILICYDRSFAEAWRVLALMGVEIIALPLTSLAWREELFLAELQTRAQESCVYVLAANRGGPEDFAGRSNTYFGLSCVIAPDGTVVATAPPRCQPAVVHATIELDALEEQRRRLPLWRDRRRDLAQIAADLT